MDREHSFLGIHGINVFVRDQEESLRFYVDRLGFDVAFDARLQSGDRWVAVAPPDGSAVLSLIAPSPDSKEYQLIGRSTGVVFVSEDVIAKYRDWRTRGVQFSFTPRLRRVKYDRPGASEPGSDPWGGVFTRFRDLDGNSFLLVGLDEVNRDIDARRRLAAEKLESERRAAQELEIAKQVQARLFPQHQPHIETLDYAGICIQARQVGGDYYDFLDLGRGRFALVIGDIAGKGMPAALLMANLQANLRSQISIALEEPERLLRSVNRLFFGNTPESAYATLIFAIYDDASRTLSYANCGHLCGLLFRAGGSIEKLPSTGTVMGLFEEWDCPIHQHSILPGDTLALYTDGVTEAFNPAGEDFGEHRLIQAIERHRELPPCRLISSLVDEIQRFSPHEQHDDITLIVARCK